MGRCSFRAINNMRLFQEIHSPELSRMLQEGAVGILRTDTLYGVVARADTEVAVERVYDLKDRDNRKSPIVLIASIDQLWDTPPEIALSVLQKTWPGPVSVILPSTKAPVWIRRDNGSVAYRLPADEALQSLLRQTGPLIAPSANPEGQPPAMTVTEAREYFGDAVDFYVEGGTVKDATASQLIKVYEDGHTERLR